VCLVRLVCDDVISTVAMFREVDPSGQAVCLKQEAFFDDYRLRASRCERNSRNKKAALQTKHVSGSA